MLSRLRIGSRLRLGSGGILALTARPGSVSIDRIAQVEGAAADLAFQSLGSAAARQCVQEACARARIAVAVLTFTALGIGTLLARSIAVSIERTPSEAKPLAGGGTAAALHDHGDDETLRLLGALQRMDGRLAHRVSRVRQDSEPIAASRSQGVGGEAGFGPFTAIRPAGGSVLAADSVRATVVATVATVATSRSTSTSTATVGRIPAVRRAAG